MRNLSIGMWIGSTIALCMGFYKMLVYSNPESLYAKYKNAYVGSDAANFTINGTYATAYFVLFAALLIGGLLVELIRVFKLSNPEVFKVEAVKKEEIEKKDPNRILTEEEQSQLARNPFGR